MDFRSIKQSATGASLAIVVFVLISPAITPVVVASSSSTYFSFTMIAPNTNPVRVQWAEIIQNSYQANGIAANLIFTAFGPLIDRVWGGQVTPSTPLLFSQGGYDAIFIGWGGGTNLPDYGTDNVVNYKSSNAAAEFPPNGNNYAFFDNATYNTLANEFAVSFNVTQREKLAQQMVRIVAQQRPYLIIIGGLGATPDNPVASYVYPWNQQATWNTANSGVDFQHWKLTGGHTQINVGLSADLTCQDSPQTTLCNSIYDAWMTNYGAPVEELDPRTLNYVPGTATSVTSTPDHLTWSVTIRPHNWQDSAPVRADDYIFTYFYQLQSAVGALALGTLQGLFGFTSSFTFSNGTTWYTDNGTAYYSAASLPAGFKAASTFQAFNGNNTWKFTLPVAYPFTDPILTAGLNANGGPLPMHLLEQIPANKFTTSYWVTLQNTPITVKWDSAQYGGNGSYAYAYGVISDGPYLYHGYDKVAKVATEIKWPGYWNTTGLESIGEFTAQVVHVVTINGKDAALAAFSNGQVNALDNNYEFDKTDAAAVTAAGGVNIFMNAPNNGWQELGLNLHDPVFGTGTGTPNGQKDPAHAAAYARDVRQAMSYLIPRTQIVQQLLQGLGVEGITQFCTCFPAYMPAGLAPDPYNPNAALSYLAAAGYNTGVAPPSSSTTIGSNFNTKISVPGSTVVAPSFLLGQSFTLSGQYAPLPSSLMIASGGFAVVLEQSTDGGTTWLPVDSAFANTGGYFSLTYTPTLNGTLEYRLFYSGLNATWALGGQHSNNKAYGTPGAIEAVVPPYNPVPGAWKNSTDTYYGPTSTLNVGTLQQLISQLASGAQLTSVANQLSSSLAGVSSSINTMTGQQQTANSNISNLQSSVSTLTDVAYAALAVAIILGLAAVALSRRRPGS